MHDLHGVCVNVTYKKERGEWRKDLARRISTGTFSSCSSDSPPIAIVG